jgi:AcrR family transcriptional regulator
MARKTNPSAKIVTATLKLAAITPWREVSLENIAEAAKIKPDRLTELFPNKVSILDAYNCQLDEKTIMEFASNKDEGTTRDQLFDILMARFDSLTPHKKAIKAILKETIPNDPIACAHGVRALLRSMRSILELVGIRSTSPIGCLKTKSLSAVYLRSFKIWLDDDSSDLAKTMASLDDGLAKAETYANLIPNAI